MLVLEDGKVKGKHSWGQAGTGVGVVILGFHWLISPHNHLWRQHPLPDPIRHLGLREVLGWPTGTQRATTKPASERTSILLILPSVLSPLQKQVGDKTETQITSIVSIHRFSRPSRHTSHFQPHQGYTFEQLGHPPVFPSYVYALPSQKQQSRQSEGHGAYGFAGTRPGHQW